MFELAHEWIILLLPLAWLVRMFARPAVVEQSSAIKFPFFKTLSSFIGGKFYHNNHTTNLKYLVALVWFLLVFAAAGPQWLGAPQELPRAGRDLMLAVDLSGSMQIPDMNLRGKPVSRLEVVKQVASKFIAQREGDRVGLILFGTRAYLQTPLTFDRKTVLAMLNDASVGLAGKQTAIGDAIGLAIKRLQHTPEKSRVLVLLTDGASNTGVLEPMQAAKLAAEDHIKIYTIGLGADRLVINSLLGTQMINPSADLDINVLKNIAATTGGLFFRAKNTKGLQQIYQEISRLEPNNAQKSVFRPVKPLYPWPLGLAMILCGFLIGRKMNWLPKASTSKQSEMA